MTLIKTTTIDVVWFELLSCYKKVKIKRLRGRADWVQSFKTNLLDT